MAPAEDKRLGEVRVMQHQLASLGIEPPAPRGIDLQAATFRPRGRQALRAYHAQLAALLRREAARWKPKEHLHPVLAAAQAAAPERERLPLPVHGGVPARPTFRNLGALRVTRFLLEAVRPVVTKAQRPVFDAGVKLLEAVLDPRSQVPRAERLALFRLVIGAVGGHVDLPAGVAPALATVSQVSTAAYQSQFGTAAEVRLRRAAVSAVEALRLKSGAVRRLLTGLDAALVREDFAAVLEGHVEGGGTLEACLFRAAKDGRTTHWLGTLTDGRFVLAYQVRGRLQVVTGGSDEVLASVPDVHLEGALRAVMG